MVQEKLRLVQYSVAGKRAGPIHIWHLEVRTGNTYRHTDVSIYISTFWYLIFSVPITKGSNKWLTINTGSRKPFRAPCRPSLASFHVFLKSTLKKTMQFCSWQTVVKQIKKKRPILQPAQFRSIVWYGKRNMGRGQTQSGVTRNNIVGPLSLSPLPYTVQRKYRNIKNTSK
jgi:hypothetical protein